MNNWTKYPLNGEWQLSWIENSTFKQLLLPYNTISSLKISGMNMVNATVPGNFELDLLNAGRIKNPYFGTNILKMQEFECVHMFYFRSFYYDSKNNGQLYLHFEGVDTIADVYLDGQLVMSCDNMFIAHETPLNEMKTGYHELIVHIKPAVIEARKHELAAGCSALPYNYDSLYIRKAASMYGWDIMPRLVSGGIWRDVYLFEKPEERIEDVFAYTTRINKDAGTANITFHYNLKIDHDLLKDYKIKVTGVCGDSEFSAESELWFTAGKLGTSINNCKLWFPRNYGLPNLYDTVFELFYCGELLDTFSFKFGIRMVALDRSSTTDEEGNGEFCIRVNNEKIFAMGTNWVPLDAFHSNDVNRLPEVLPMLDDLGCNIVRCWGGNVYEHEDFYDYCDEHGIMVWQDFAMGCGRYPQDREFCDALQKEAVNIVKKYRNHASLVIWAGDNECDQGYSKNDPLSGNPNDNILTRHILPEVLRAHDFTRPYLPSSPYMDEKAFESGEPLSEEHLWGPRDYFKGDYYSHSVCHFASETGYHGCPSPKSLKKFISPDCLWPWFDKEKDRVNDDWLAHAASPELRAKAVYSYRIKLMSDQVKTLFGAEPDNLNDFSLASQISQAEAKKYFIERFRISKWRRTGIIWWNLIDGWPQISDAVVDFYFEKKLAYYYIRRSQQPLCLMFDEPGVNLLPLFAVNDTGKDIKVSYRVTDKTTNEVITQNECIAKANASIKIWDKPYVSGEKHFYLIEWDGSVSGKNHYMTGLLNITLEGYVAAMKACGFELPV
ncbi:MAG: glycoside hydrolase family 2 TIM barrel-domain containing protein [Eubacteriales bacterium]